MDVVVDCSDIWRVSSNEKGYAVLCVRNSDPRTCFSGMRTFRESLFKSMLLFVTAAMAIEVALSTTSYEARDRDDCGMHAAGDTGVGGSTLVLLTPLPTYGSACSACSDDGPDALLSVAPSARDCAARAGSCPHCSTGLMFMQSPLSTGEMFMLDSASPELAGPSPL